MRTWDFAVLQAIDQFDHAVKLAPPRRDGQARELRDNLRAIQANCRNSALPGISSGPALQPTPPESDDE